MSVRVRQSGEEPQAAAQRRPLTQKECAAKTSQALVFGLLIFAAAVAVPATIAHFALGYFALKQFYIVAYWAGLQRRLRRGEAIEIVTTPGVPRGYVPSFPVAMLATLAAFVCTFITLLLFFSPVPRGDEMMYLWMGSFGLWWAALCLWRKAVPPPVTRAVIRQTLDSSTASTATGSDPLAFDLDGAQSTPNANAPTAVHPVSQRKHWWTDTQLRDENRPDAGR